MLVLSDATVDLYLIKKKKPFYSEMSRFDGQNKGDIGQQHTLVHNNGQGAKQKLYS